MLTETNQTWKINERGALVYKIGDCLKLLPEIPDKFIDLIITDLPYGQSRCAWDTPIDLNLLWFQYKRIIKDRGAILLTASQPFTSVLVLSNPDMFRYEWIWEKPQATGHLNAKIRPMKAHENILVFYKRLPKYHPQKTTGHKPINQYTRYLKTQNKTRIYGPCKTEQSGGGATDRYPRSVQVFSKDTQTSSIHDTQKPLALIKYLIKTYTDEGDWVHDSCLGRGTTLKACEDLNRNCIGFEISDKWEQHYTGNRQ